MTTDKRRFEEAIEAQDRVLEALRGGSSQKLIADALDVRLELMRARDGVVKTTEKEPCL